MVGLSASCPLVTLGQAQANGGPQAKYVPNSFFLASMVAQLVKNSPAMWEIWVQSLGWEDPLEEGVEIHATIPAWRIPMDREAWWATVHGVSKSWRQVSD